MEFWFVGLFLMIFLYGSRKGVSNESRIGDGGKKRCMEGSCFFLEEGGNVV